VSIVRRGWSNGRRLAPSSLSRILYSRNRRITEHHPAQFDESENINGRRLSGHPLCTCRARKTSSITDDWRWLLMRERLKIAFSVYVCPLLFDCHQSASTCRFMRFHFTKAHV